MGGASERIDALYRRWGPLIYRRCRQLLKVEAEASDATHEVFLRALVYESKLEKAAVAVPWLWEVATRHCLNVLRNARTRGEVLAVARPPTAPQNMEEALADRSVARALLERVDTKTGVIAVYALVDGMSQEEVAQALGITRKTVGVRLNRFKTRAQTFLRRG
jgi:RNA polymerase sigma-70 factor (ECF subfamily)